MQATCECGGKWECVPGRAIRCESCGTENQEKIKHRVLSVREDFTTTPPSWLQHEGETPRPASINLVTVGHLIRTIEEASHALRSAMIDAKLSDPPRGYEYINEVKALESQAYQLRRRLEDFAKQSNSQLYMLS